MTHIPFGGQYHDKTERLAKGCAGLLLSEGSEPNNYTPFYNVQTESHILFAATLFSVCSGTIANVIWVLVLLRNTSVLSSPSCRGYSVHRFVCIPACSFKHAVAAMRKYITIVLVCSLCSLMPRKACTDKRLPHFTYATRASARNSLVATSREYEGNDVKRREKAACLVVEVLRERCLSSPHD